MRLGQRGSGTSILKHGKTPYYYFNSDKTKQVTVDISIFFRLSTLPKSFRSSLQLSSFFRVLSLSRLVWLSHTKHCCLAVIRLLKLSGQVLLLVPNPQRLVLTLISAMGRSVYSAGLWSRDHIPIRSQYSIFEPRSVACFNSNH